MWTTPQGDYAAKKATVASAQYNVKRLEDLQSFQKIYAPFDGVITARNTDVGQLIDSGSSGGPGKGTIPHRRHTHLARVH